MGKQLPGPCEECAFKNRGCTGQPLLYWDFNWSITVWFFLSLRINDQQMVRLGETLLLVGVVALLLPLGETSALLGFGLIGFGCAPIFPAILHATPHHFGISHSQSIIGVQMASATLVPA